MKPFHTDIPRILEKQIQKQFGKNKVILLTGARRVGKTLLLEHLTAKYKGPYQLLNGEDFDIQHLLANRSAAHYKRITGNATLLIIDEAQHIPDAGKILKLMIDTQRQLTIVASGSSSFDLVQQTGEPLTGRKINFELFPISQAELLPMESALQTRQNLEERMIYGSYPELFHLNELKEKEKYLEEIVQAYLMKDVLAYEDIRNSAKIFQLLKLIAFQVGNEVSINELSRQLGIHKSVVERFLDLLTKVFVLFRLGGFSSNLRKEIVKSSKWYFVDNGIRNAVIKDFRLLTSRNDKGALWENYLITERIKYNTYLNRSVEYFFWRTYDGQEIDLIERENTTVRAFEFKWNNTKAKAPAYFTKSYPHAPFQIVSTDNYLTFIT